MKQPNHIRVSRTGNYLLRFSLLHASARKYGCHRKHDLGCCDVIECLRGEDVDIGQHRPYTLLSESMLRQIVSQKQQAREMALFEVPVAPSLQVSLGCVSASHCLLILLFSRWSSRNKLCAARLWTRGKAGSAAGEIWTAGDDGIVRKYERVGL